MRSRDQGKFSSIKNLDPGRGWFYSPYESDHPLKGYPEDANEGKKAIIREKAIL